ncbi:hypothetical protein BG262_06820 [Floricoccus penangensis]|uniref:Uncharacterized protein n=1 Tax=Floricoccus penangensis TaxID=1859475 RepID=A0A9Q5NYK4_9LACT|nr:hypothetical protein [Floricoccus penangensis]OFI45703.1 hypothetical protein BG262_06820 [Floricoccus penangensis]
MGIKLLNATFDQSTNLIKDKDILRQENKMVKDLKGNPLRISLSMIILTLVLWVGLGFISIVFYANEIYFFHIVFWIWSILWISGIFINRKIIKYKSLVPYRFTINVNNFCMMIFFTIVVALIIFYSVITDYNSNNIVCITITLGTLTSTIILINKIKNLKLTLFNKINSNGSSESYISKILDKFMTFSVIFLIIALVFSDTANDLIGNMNSKTLSIFLIISIFLFIVAIAIYEIHIVFPYILMGYYKNKYPEEYRKLEGQTQIEWYGEKYFNKYIT